MHWKIIFPFLAKSRAHMHTLYGSVCTWARDFARNGKIIFQHNCNSLYSRLLFRSNIPLHIADDAIFCNCNYMGIQNGMKLSIWMEKKSAVQHFSHCENKFFILTKKIFHIQLIVLISSNWMTKFIEVKKLKIVTTKHFYQFEKWIFTLTNALLKWKFCFCSAHALKYPVMHWCLVWEPVRFSQSWTMENPMQLLSRDIST